MKATVIRAELERAIIAKLSEYYAAGVSTISLTAPVEIPTVGKLRGIRVTPQSVITTIGNAARVASIDTYTQFVNIEGEVIL